MKSLRRCAAVLAALIILAGCGPQAPVYRDTLADLSKARAADVPLDIPVKAGPTTAFTFGSNVESFLKYHDDSISAVSSFASQKILSDANPQVLVDGGVSVLRRRYPAIKAVDDLKAAERAKISTTFVLDILTKHGIWPGDVTTIDIVVIALDGQMMPVSRLNGHGTLTVRPYVAPDVGAANRMAIADLAAKAQRLLN